MEKSMRLAGPALAAAVLLLAGACSSGDDGGAEAKDDKPDTEQTDPDGTEGEDADADGPGGGLDSAYTGVWASNTGEALLRLGDDGIAALILESGPCLGAANEAAGQTMVSVRCEQSTEFTVGIATVDGQQLTIDWEGTGQRMYTWMADLDVGFGELDLGELNLDFDGFDPGELDLDGIDLSDLEGLLPPGGIDIGSD